MQFETDRADARLRSAVTTAIVKRMADCLVSEGADLGKKGNAASILTKNGFGKRSVAAYLDDARAIAKRHVKKAGVSGAAILILIAGMYADYAPGSLSDQSSARIARRADNHLRTRFHDVPLRGSVYEKRA